jgi:hypothetical protein
MTEKLAEEIITSVLNYRQEGVDEDYELIDKLKTDYAKFEVDFEWFLEMMNTAVFRANFIMSHGKYPPSNLDDDVVLKTAFKMYWVEHKGEADCLNKFGPKKKWWHFK